jgi:RES domain-containing protein
VTLCFRLAKAKYPPNSGAGAALQGGRWNPKGLEVIYASATLSLAVTEVLVHYSVLAHGFAYTPIRIPSSVPIEALSKKDLPAGWDELLYTPESQALGSRWVNEGRSAVLRVPSTIVASEWNYLINPKHKAFKQIEFLRPMPFRFDPRLK